MVTIMKLKIKRIKELFALGFSYIKTQGLMTTIKKTLRFAKRRFGGKKGRFIPTKKALEQKKQFVADFLAQNGVKISICIPVYNTPEKYLTQLLNSIQGQIYTNWQLCIADASDEQGEKIVKKVLDRYKIGRASCRERVCLYV